MRKIILTSGSVSRRALFALVRIPLRINGSISGLIYGLPLELLFEALEKVN